MGPGGELDVGALSVLPALVTIGLAFATRQVIAALLAGVLTGSLVLLLSGASPAEANPITRFLLPAVGSSRYAQILLIYLWCLGGLIGIWSKTGGAQHLAHTVGSRLARGPRSSLFYGWLIGMVFHQGGTVSTVLAGTTVKPVADRHRVSHEELAYVVDSTASPVATVIPLNAWPTYVAGLAAGTVPLIPDEAAGYRFFLSSLPYNYYAIFALLGTLGLALGVLPWVGGRMAAARERARSTGALDAPGAEPMLPTGAQDHPVAGYASSLADFAVPIGVLIGVALIPFVFFDANWINEAFALCVLSAMGLAALRGLPISEVLDGFVSGCRSMTIGAIVLGLAVTLGDVSKELGTAAWVVRGVGDAVPALALPALLTALCMGIAFATGTSWGTYAVVFPVALPLAWALQPDPAYLQVCFGAVLGGSVFGDQCSPISDTTILSSMFTGCDLMDHVRTQLPLAMVAAVLGGVASTAAVLWVAQ
jgi:Na+/H+ antiporter NhaC